MSERERERERETNRDRQTETETEFRMYIAYIFDTSIINIKDINYVHARQSCLK